MGTRTKHNGEMKKSYISQQPFKGWHRQNAHQGNRGNKRKATKDEEKKQKCK